MKKRSYQLILALSLISLNLNSYGATAIFAGGCFWCVEADFDKVKGVTKTVSGYDGGSRNNPSYGMVSSGVTGYVEAVQVTFDPAIVSYQQLLDYYWRHIDPQDDKGQFCDKGKQYRSVIFYINDEQKQLALASKRQLSKRFPYIATDILASTKFYPAEQYHQNYYKKNPLRYNYYRYRCGRDQRIKEVWK